jgi:type VI secretion system protein VasJ
MPLVACGAFGSVQALLEPVDPQTPAGLFDLEDETYQAIDHEMVKLGGLHQASIDWPFVEEASSHYLATQCKHLRVVGHLLSAWLKVGRWDAWCDSIKLLMGMIEHYWQSSYPKPGPTGFPAKRRQVSGLLELLSATVPGSRLRSGRVATAG